MPIGGGFAAIASLEDPLTAARVEALRRAGRDWFREWLLPDACDRLQRSVAPYAASNLSLVSPSSMADCGAEAGGNSCSALLSPGSGSNN